ncbi:prepilin peptidase [Gammaproteobacteria bacterium]|nr:prepilin peptidase [Gammaproteobacteria bacterium]
MNIELSILLSLFALSVGSFVNSFIYRYPLINRTDLNLFKPRSFCPKCMNQLKISMLFPIFSYIYLKGKCSFCKEKIDTLYLVNEIAHLFIMLMILVSMPIGISSIIIFIIFSILYTQMILDYKYFLLSISLNAILIVLGLTLNYGFNYFVTFYESIIGLVAGYSILWVINTLFYLVRKKEGIGGGDFLLFAGCGSLFGFISLGPILLISSSISLLIFAIKKETSETKIPLGTGLALGAIIYFLLIKFFSILQ